MIFFLYDISENKSVMKEKQVMLIDSSSENHGILEVSYRRKIQMVKILMHGCNGKWDA